MGSSIPRQKFNDYSTLSNKSGALTDACDEQNNTIEDGDTSDIIIEAHQFLKSLTHKVSAFTHECFGHSKSHPAVIPSSLFVHVFSLGLYPSIACSFRAALQVCGKKLPTVEIIIIAVLTNNSRGFFPISVFCCFAPPPCCRMAIASKLTESRCVLDVSACK